MQKTIGQKLLDLLNENGITQAQVAEKTGLSAKHVNWLVKDRSPLSIEVAVLIEEHFPQIQAFPLLMTQLRLDVAKVKRRRALFEYAPGNE